MLGTKKCNKKNEQVPFCAFLHKELYRCDKTAEPRLYVLILFMFLNKGKYIIFTVLPIVLGNKNLPNSNIYNTEF